MNNGRSTQQGCKFHIPGLSSVHWQIREIICSSTGHLHGSLKREPTWNSAGYWLLMLGGRVLRYENLWHTLGEPRVVCLNTWTLVIHHIQHSWFLVAGWRKDCSNGLQNGYVTLWLCIFIVLQSNTLCVKTILSFSSFRVKSALWALCMKFCPYT